MTSHDPYAALRFRDYRCLLAAGVVGSIGMEIQAVAVGWDLWQRTRYTLDLGLAGLAQFIPVLLFSLPAGHLADRYNRKTLYQLALGMVVLSSLGLTALSHFDGPIWAVFLCLFVTGLSRAVSAPARASLVPLVVPLELLANAITWNSSGWQIANVVGPALGGVAIALGGTVEAYALAAACSFVSIMLAVPVRPRQAARQQGSPTWQSLLAGVRFVFQSKLLLAAITLDLFAVLLGGATALLPVFADDILDVGPTGLGWLRAAPAAGAFVMAMVLAHRPPLQHPGRALLLAVAGFGAATIVFGISADPLLSFAMLALTGALDNISVVVRHTLVQSLTPDDMRGRVASVNLVFISSSNELGAFESGAAASIFGSLRDFQSDAEARIFGSIMAVIVGGIGTIAVVILVTMRRPELLGLGPLHRLTAVEARDEDADVSDGVAH